MTDAIFKACLSTSGHLRHLAESPLDPLLLNNLVNTITGTILPNPREYRIVLAFCRSVLAAYALVNNPNDSSASAMLKHAHDTPIFDDKEHQYFMAMLDEIATFPKKLAFLAPNHCDEISQALKSALNQKCVLVREKLIAHIKANRWANNANSVIAVLEKSGNQPLDANDNTTQAASFHSTIDRNVQLVLLLNCLGWGPFDHRNISSPLIKSLTEKAGQAKATSSFLSDCDSVGNLTSQEFRQLTKLITATTLIPPDVRQNFIEQCMHYMPRSHQAFPKLFYPQPTPPIVAIGDELIAVTTRLRALKLSDHGERDNNSNYDQRYHRACTWVVYTPKGTPIVSDHYENFAAFAPIAKRFLPAYLHDWFNYCNPHSMIILTGNLQFHGSPRAVIELTPVIDESGAVISCLVSAHVTYVLYDAPGAKPAFTLTMHIQKTEENQNHIDLYPIECTSFNLSFFGWARYQLGRERHYLFVKYAPEVDRKLELESEPESGDSSDGAEGDIDNAHKPYSIPKPAFYAQCAYADDVSKKIRECLQPDIVLQPVEPPEIAIINESINGDDTIVLTIHQHLLRVKLALEDVTYQDISYSLPSTDHPPYIHFFVCLHDSSYIRIAAMITWDTDKNNTVKNIQLITGEEGILTGLESDQTKARPIETAPSSDSDLNPGTPEAEGKPGNAKNKGTRLSVRRDRSVRNLVHAIGRPSGSSENGSGSERDPFRSDEELLSPPRFKSGGYPNRQLTRSSSSSSDSASNDGDSSPTPWYRWLWLKICTFVSWLVSQCVDDKKDKIAHHGGNPPDRVIPSVFVGPENNVHPTDLPATSATGDRSLSLQDDLTQPAGKPASRQQTF